MRSPPTAHCMTAKALFRLLDLTWPTSTATMLRLILTLLNWLSWRDIATCHNRGQQAAVRPPLNCGEASTPRNGHPRRLKNIPPPPPPLLEQNPLRVLVAREMEGPRCNRLFLPVHSFLSARQTDTKMSGSRSWRRRCRRRRHHKCVFGGWIKKRSGGFSTLSLGTSMRTIRC